jgi:hypothetical protein
VLSISICYCGEIGDVKLFWLVSSYGCSCLHFSIMFHFHYRSWYLFIGITASVELCVTMASGVVYSVPSGRISCRWFSSDTCYG